MIEHPIYGNLHYGFRDCKVEINFPGVFPAGLKVEYYVSDPDYKEEREYYQKLKTNIVEIAKTLLIMVQKEWQEQECALKPDQEGMMLGCSLPRSKLGSHLLGFMSMEVIPYYTWNAVLEDLTVVAIFQEMFDPRSYILDYYPDASDEEIEKFFSD